MICDLSRVWGDADRFVAWTYMAYFAFSKGKLAIALDFSIFYWSGTSPHHRSFFADETVELKNHSRQLFQLSWVNPILFQGFECIQLVCLVSLLFIGPCLPVSS